MILDDYQVNKLADAVRGLAGKVEEVTEVVWEDNQMGVLIEQLVEPITKALAAHTKTIAQVAILDHTDKPEIAVLMRQALAQTAGLHLMAKTDGC